MSDRKYRQRGYQDSGSERSERGPRRPRSDRPSGPRTRGLGKPTSTVFRCAVCGEKQLASSGVELDSTCWKCGADLHTCTHCRYFDSSAPRECRQPVKDYVSSKAKRNSCELFEAKEAQEHGQNESPSDAKAAFDALFKI